MQNNDLSPTSAARFQGETPKVHIIFRDGRLARNRRSIAYLLNRVDPADIHGTITLSKQRQITKFVSYFLNGEKR